MIYRMSTLAAALVLAAGALGTDPSRCKVGPPRVHPAGSLECFVPLESDGLFCAVTQLSADCSLNPTGDPNGGYRFDRRISMAGSVTDPTGVIPFRIAGVWLTRMLDRQGEDVVARGLLEAYPSGQRAGAFQQPPSHPGSARTEGFSVAVSNLAAIPSGLSAVEGYLTVEVPRTSVELTLDPGASEGVALTPALSVRVRRYRHEAGHFIAQIEYRIDRAKLEPGQAPPLVLGASVLDEENQLLADVSYAQEQAARNTIVGVIPVQVHLRAKVFGRLVLRIATDVREIRFDFAAADVPLGG